MTVIAYIYVCLVGGTAFMAIRMGMNAGFSPLYFAGIRFLLAGGILLGYLALSRQLAPLTPLNLRRILQVGLFTTSIRFAALYWAQQYIPSGQAALLSATYPLMVILVHSVDGRNMPPRHQWMGLLGGFTGVFLIMQAPVQIPFSNLAWLGTLAVLGGELVNAIATITARKVLQSGIGAWQMNALQMLFGSVLLLALAWFREPFPTVQIWQAGFIPLIYLTFAGSIGGTSTFYWLVSKMGPIIPSTWSYFSPVIALTAGSLMLKEIFTVRQLTGALLIVVFVAIAQFWPRISRAIHSH